MMVSKTYLNQKLCHSSGFWTVNVLKQDQTIDVGKENAPLSVKFSNYILMEEFKHVPIEILEFEYRDDSKLFRTIVFSGLFGCQSLRIWFPG